MKNSISTLVHAYGNEKDARVKDRMFLVKRVVADGEIPSHVA